jgi:hypothetical protein
MDEIKLLLSGGEMKLIFLGIGSLAFFATLYLAVQHPELVESPGETKQELSENPLRKWDIVITWIMWGGWGCAALLTFLDRNGYLDILDP